MYKYYNAHPCGLVTDDCVKRAITVTTGMAYADVQRALNRYKKVTGAKSFNSDRNPHRYVENVLSAKKIVFPKMTALQFCQNYPKGRFILDMKEHWSCAVDGVIYDIWDCSDETVNYAYQITSPPKKQTLRYACTTERISESETRIRIYDGNGVFVERTVPTPMTDGYIRCLEDSHYTYVKFNEGATK